MGHQPPLHEYSGRADKRLPRGYGQTQPPLPGRPGHIQGTPPGRDELLVAPTENGERPLGYGEPCRYCGHVYESDAIYCERCGKRRPEVSCPNCEHIYEGDSTEFCTICGRQRNKGIEGQSRDFKAQTPNLRWKETEVCKYCKTSWQHNDRNPYCRKCGKPRPQLEPRCRTCELPFDSSDRFCRACGTARCFQQEPDKEAAKGELNLKKDPLALHTPAAFRDKDRKPTFPHDQAHHHGFGKKLVDTGEGVPTHFQSWYEPWNDWSEEQVIAWRHLLALRKRVDELFHRGKCLEGKWTNDPVVFPLGTINSTAGRMGHIANRPDGGGEERGRFVTLQNLIDPTYVRYNGVHATVLHHDEDNQAWDVITEHGERFQVRANNIDWLARPPLRPGQLVVLRNLREPGVAYLNGQQGVLHEFDYDVDAWHLVSANKKLCVKKENLIAADADNSNWTEVREDRHGVDIVPFPPHDQQFYISGFYDPLTSRLKPSQKPRHGLDLDGNSCWVRMTSLAPHSAACHLFSQAGNSCAGYHLGRVFRGALETGYLAEALNAISLRPKLAKDLFFCYDVEKSIFVARLYKHGTWFRIELDDYVPISVPHDGEGGPLCCQSEYFPHVLWPSLAEKAYAKLCTKRGNLCDSTPGDTGGWEAIGMGGRLEDALVLYTGGVAGRFETHDVTADRLFIYLYELQRDTLFVCRVNEAACDQFDVPLNPYYPYVVNRAATFEGGCYVQVFCGAPTVYDGGLQDISVPYALATSQVYPETMGEGFFWCQVDDFHLYFGTIFECRLTNSGDVSIPGMPPTRLPGVLPALPFGDRQSLGAVPGFPRNGGPAGGLDGGPNEAWWAGAPAGATQGTQHVSPTGEVLSFYETVWANRGPITRKNEPEFTVRVPEKQVPCEIICSVDQYDKRLNMKDNFLEEPVPILLTVYEQVEENYYSNRLVCKSNWIPCSHTMVAWKCNRGGEFKIECEFTNTDRYAEKMVFRCYSSKSGVEAVAAMGSRRHSLVVPIDEPCAVKWTFVGAVPGEKIENPDGPEPFDVQSDKVRTSDQDISVSLHAGISQLSSECSVM